MGTPGSVLGLQDWFWEVLDQFGEVQDELHQFRVWGFSCEETQLQSGGERARTNPKKALKKNPRKATRKKPPKSTAKLCPSAAFHGNPKELCCTNSNELCWISAPFPKNCHFPLVATPHPIPGIGREKEQLGLGFTCSGNSLPEGWSLGCPLEKWEQQPGNEEQNHF